MQETKRRGRKRVDSDETRKAKKNGLNREQKREALKEVYRKHGLKREGEA